MDKIQVLDCTLRDGGYCNDCKFGSSNMHRIIGGLMDANIDIIECGFLSHKITYQQGVSRFSSAEQINSFIPVEKKGKKFVVLANYGDIDIDKLEPRSQNGIDGIRVAFHKKDLENAIVLCGKIKEKGYEVFIQAMVSLSYTDVEFLSLINKVNKLNPYAFYIVDSFGVMKQNDLARLFYLVDNNLNSNIILGYHAHNNLQLAHSNARFFVEINTSRDLVIDTSVMGMGRGAGNLNTEIFIEYLNNIKNKQ
ncbi:MAG: aldolase catalytic domain-containing protein, partial [Clostridia bacterium]|nr:aldolase catalytic domain-containing protein [Clostridia bacterium]